MLKLLYAAVIVCFLCLLVLAAPSHADGWQDKLSALAVTVPNDGPALGAGIGYQVHEHLWLDAFAKREAGGTDICLGASTDLQALADVASLLLGFDVGKLPPGACGGCASPVTAWEPFAYLGWRTSF